MRFYNDNEMGIRIGRLMTAYGYTLSSAESCTGGTIASMVTAIPGSSAYFKGAVVSYAVSVKEQVLGVDVSDGVVSESTARQMAEGVSRVLQSDCSVATTGIAGPGGGEPGKPVGTVCIAAHIQGLTVTRTFCFQGGREDVILQAADASLRLLETLIIKKKVKKL